MSDADPRFPPPPPSAWPSPPVAPTWAAPPPPPPWAPRPPPKSSRTRLVVPVAVALLLLIIVGIGLAGALGTFSSGRPPATVPALGTSSTSPGTTPFGSSTAEGSTVTTAPRSTMPPVQAQVVFLEAVRKNAVFASGPSAPLVSAGHAACGALGHGSSLVDTVTAVSPIVSAFHPAVIDVASLVGSAVVTFCPQYISEIRAG